MADDEHWAIVGEAIERAQGLGLTEVTFFLNPRKTGAVEVDLTFVSGRKGVGIAKYSTTNYDGDFDVTAVLLHNSLHAAISKEEDDNDRVQ